MKLYFLLFAICNTASHPVSSIWQQHILFHMNPQLPQSQAVPDAPALPKHVVFDLPVLRRQTISQIREHLGRPNANDSEPDPERFGETQWSKTYRREGMELRIDYTLKTGKIVRFYLTPVGGAIPEKALGNLLVTGNLKPSTPGFSIKPIFVHQDPLTHRYTNLFLTVI